MQWPLQPAPRRQSIRAWLDFASFCSYFLLAFRTRFEPGALPLPKTATTVRKSPRQARSRATVEAILEATAHILVEDGYESLTTNGVAHRAGVSVGSLYQYFPNKQSLVRALLDRHLADAEALRPSALRPDAPTSLRERIRIAVDWYLAVHAADPALHQVLTELAGEIYGSTQVRALEHTLERVLRAVLARHADELRPASLEIAAFLLAQCLESFTHGAVARHPDWVGRPELAEEMTHLISGYLCRDSDQSRSQAPSP